MNKIILWVIALIATVGAVTGTVALVGGNQSVPSAPSTNVGGITNLDGLTITPLDSGDGLKVGSSGSTMTFDKFTTCTASFSSADMIATSSAVGICVDSTFAVGDKVLVTHKLSTAVGLATEGMFPSLGVVATTSGQFGLYVTNFTGAATTSINAVYRTYSYQLLR